VYERLSDFLSNVLLGGFIALAYAIDEIMNFTLPDDDGELARVRLSVILVVPSKKVTVPVGVPCPPSTH
jgi:hypothetical protein